MSLSSSNPIGNHPERSRPSGEAKDPSRVAQPIHAGVGFNRRSGFEAFVIANVGFLYLRHLPRALCQPVPESSRVHSTLVLCICAHRAARVTRRSQSVARGLERSRLSCRLARRFGRSDRSRPPSGKPFLLQRAYPAQRLTLLLPLLLRPWPIPASASCSS